MIGVLNAQSVSNKSVTIKNCIMEQKMDIFAVVESWHDSSDSPSIIACRPPDYKYIERARPRSDTDSINILTNHGGICVFFHQRLRVNVINLPNYNTMEVLALSIHSCSLTTVLLTVYRPGSSTVTNMFFDEFAQLLECCSSYNNCIVTGDVNIHLDCTAATTTKRFQTLLDNFGLVDRVCQPTHNMHHQLDVFITRIDQKQPVIHVDPPVISDHSLITAEYIVTAGVTNAVRPEIRRRKWRSLNIDNFIDDLMSSDLIHEQPENVDEFFACYNNTLSSLLDKHAPVVTVKQYSRSVSPWFDSECHVMKTKTRKLEKLYRAQPNIITESVWRSQFRQQRILFQTKYMSHWSFVIESAKGNSKMLWSKLRCLLQSPTDDATITPEHSADDFANYFVDKIEKIRQSTVSAPPPMIKTRTVPEHLDKFSPVTAAEVVSLLKRSAAKQCILDPIPTWLVKNIGGVLAPVIATMCNSSFNQNKVPTLHKTAVVRPLLKKPTLDPSDLASYRPISNLSFISKTLERLVSQRLTNHMDEYTLLPPTQSAYRLHHSTETALLRIHNDIVAAIDQGDVGALVLLDLSAAFDTVDHSVLVDVMRERFGITGDALQWIMSYLSNRTQVVTIASKSSSNRQVTSGVPQGSVLGPQQFVAYMEDVTEIFSKHDIYQHGYADDMQGLKRCDPLNIAHVSNEFQHLIKDVDNWCSSRRLQLNAHKTELIWFGSSANLDKLDPVNKRLQLDGSVVQPSDVVRDLGFYFDSELSMRQHISRLARTCFFHLRRLRSIRRQLGTDVAQRLVSAFVLSRLDYSNGLFAGLPDVALEPLQRVQNAAARLVMHLKPSDHITPALFQLHWLPVKQRILYKLCIMVYKSVNNQAPSYLSELFHPISNIPSRSALRSATTHDLDIPRTRLYFGERAFSVAGAREWNNLPSNLRSISDIHLFRRLLKTHFFKIAFKSELLTV